MRRLAAAFFVLSVLSLPSCKKGKNPLKALWATTQFDPCNPAFDYYEGDSHYFERDFVTDEGTLDTGKWLEQRSVQSSPCDPLQKHDKEKR